MAKQIKKTKYIVSIILSSSFVFLLSFFSLGNKDNSVLLRGLVDKTHADTPTVDVAVVDTGCSGGDGGGGGSAGCM